MTKKILVVLAARDFRDEEYLAPSLYWEKEGADVMTISSSKTSYGRFTTTVKNNFVFGEDHIEAGDFDAIFFVGGGGALDFMENKEAQDLAQSFVDAGKIVGAICAAPRLLLHWGILQDKKMTGWNGDEELEDLARVEKAHYTKKPVVVNGKFITADGPDSAEDCAKALWKLL